MRLLCTRTRLVSPTCGSLSRRRVHDDREQVLAAADLDRERRERALVVARLLAVDEDRRLVVDALELDRRALAVDRTRRR